MPKVTWDIDGNIKPLESKLKKADKLAENTGGKLQGLGSKAFGMLGGAAVGAGVLAATVGIANLGGELETTRLQFQTFLGSVDKGNKMLDELSEFANFTPFSNDQVNKAAKTLLSFGFAADEVKPTLKLLGDVSAGTGKDLGELGVIFGQIRGAGRLMGGDLLQLINAGFNPLQNISQRTGKSMGELKDDMSKGLISFDDVKQAFKDATSEGGLFNGMTAKLSNSFQGKLSTALGKGRFLLQKIGEKQLPVFNKGLDAAISLIDNLAGEEEKRSVGMRRDIAVSGGLFNALKRSNLEAGERTELIKEINGKYGKYLDNLLTEKSSIDEVREAQDKLTNSLERQLRVQLKQEAQKEILRKQAVAIMKLDEIRMQKAGIEALKGVKDQKARSEIAKSFGLPQTTQLGRREGQLDRQEIAVQKNLENINKSLESSNAAFKSTFGDMDGNLSSDKGSSSSKAAASTTKTTNGGAAIIGGKDIKNVIVNIDSLIETVNFASMTGQSEKDLQDKITRVLVGAVNNYERLAGG